MKRDFEQFRAEVYRRTEEKKRKQKRLRTTLFSLCIPLVLCVGTLFLFPAVGTKSEDAAIGGTRVQNTAGMLEEEDEECAESKTVRCEILRGESNTVTEDPDFLERLDRILQKCKSTGSVSDDSKHPEGPPKDTEVFKTLLKLTDTNGSCTEYTVLKCENGICLLKEAAPISLSEEDLGVLLELIEEKL